MRVIKQDSLLLPTLSAVLSVIALPPFSLSVFGLFALVPLYWFVFKTNSVARLIIGLITYKAIFAGYTIVSTLYGFTWFEDTVLFSWFMYGSGVLIFLTVLAVASVWAYGIWFLQKVIAEKLRWWGRISIFLSYVGIDGVLSYILFGFNYGSFVYVAVDMFSYFPTYFHPSTTAWYIAAIILCNAILAEFSIAWSQKRVSIEYFLVGLLIGIFTPLLLFVTDSPAPKTDSGLRISIIQDVTTDKNKAFGKVEDGNFTFPRLEETLNSIQDEDLDIIIYPFNPWSGVLGASSDDNIFFDREVIVVTEEQFADWLTKQLNPEVVFITWYTRYDKGNFYNEIVYWKNGKVLNSYQKEKLFPFFDYTPNWAEQIGFYSLPIDATAGTDNKIITVGDTRFGHAICSEITSTEHVSSQLNEADVLLSIGSETMFSNDIPSIFNAAKSQLYALQHHKPIIRASRTGPSVVYDKYGRTASRLDLNEHGVLTFVLPQ